MSSEFGLSMPRLKKKWMQQPAAPASAVLAPVAKSAPDYMNLKQAADFMGVTVWTIRGYIKSHDLKYAQLGKRFIVKREDLDKLWKQKAA